jgi:hypothetical protein
MPGLDDYGQLLRSGAASVPDYAADEVKKQLAAAQIGQERRLEEAQQRELADEDAFHNDLTTVLAHPSAQGYSALALKHPKFAAQIKSGFEMQDKAKQDSDLQSMSEVYAAAANNKYDLAASLMQRRIDADKEAGQPDDGHDQAILDALKSGDPVQQKGALGMIGVTLSAVTGPDKFEQTLGALTKGSTPEIREVQAGATVAERDPVTGKWKETYRSPYLKTADGGLLEADNPGGGDPSSPGAATTAAPGGFDHAVEHVLANEGGYAAHDMNGAPVNYGINQAANPGVNVKDLTKDQARQIYHDKYWVPSGAESLPANMQAPYFDVYIRNPKFAKAALARSGGDPEKFMDQADSYFQGLAAKPENQKYAHPYAVRDAKNRAIATGSTEPSATHPTQGDAPPGYHWLTPPKPKDAPAGFRYKADGNLEPIPGGPADQEDGVDDQTATFYAQQMLAGGQMPTLGMGKAAAQARQKILKKVAQIAGAEGLTGNDLAVQVGHYKANMANVQNLEKQAGTIEQNEQTALANGQQFIDRSTELSAQTRFPIVNSATQTYLRHTGDPTVAAMDAAWNTFTTEYAKVVAGSPSGAGTLSDSARHEAQETMRGNYSVEQKRAAFKQMQADMANRMAAIHNQVAKGYKSLGSRAPGIGVNAGASGDLPKGAKVIGTHNGKRVIEVNGKRMVEQ